MAKEIELQNGMKAIVDDEDYERVNQHNWTAVQHHKTTMGVKRFVGKRHQNLSYFILGHNNNNDKLVITHKNKNPLDYRKCNLVAIDRKKLSQTTRGCRNASSKYKGVSWCKATRKWKTQIQVNGKNIYLGVRKLEKDAATLYNEAARKYFGEHAYQNNIGEDNSAIALDIPKANKVLRSIRKPVKSKYRGTFPHHKGWTASIQGKYLGFYKTETEAAKAYNEKAKELFGDKAILNDIPNMEESSC